MSIQKVSFTGNNTPKAPNSGFFNRAVKWGKAAGVAGTIGLASCSGGNSVLPEPEIPTPTKTVLSETLPTREIQMLTLNGAATVRSSANTKASGIEVADTFHISALGNFKKAYKRLDNLSTTEKSVYERKTSDSSGSLFLTDTVTISKADGGLAVKGTADPFNTKYIFDADNNVIKYFEGDVYGADYIPQAKKGVYAFRFNTGNYAEGLASVDYVGTKNAVVTKSAVAEALVNVGKKAAKLIRK